MSWQNQLDTGEIREFGDIDINDIRSLAEQELGACYSELSNL